MASNLITPTQWPAPSALTSFISANIPSSSPESQSETSTRTAPPASSTKQPDPLHTLALQVLHNLQYQHDWSDVRLHTHTASLHDVMRDWRSSTSGTRAPTAPSTDSASQSGPPPITSTSEVSSPSTDTLDSQPSDEPLSRPLLTGTPPHHLYIHPDVQTALIKSGKREEDLPIEPVIVCPSHIREGGWSLAKMARVFDQLPMPERGWIGGVLGRDRGSEGGGKHEGRSGLREGRATGGSSTEAEGAKVKEASGLDEKKRVLLAVVESDSTIVYYWVHDGLVKPRQN